MLGLHCGCIATWGLSRHEMHLWHAATGYIRIRGHWGLILNSSHNTRSPDLELAVQHTAPQISMDFKQWQHGQSLHHDIHTRVQVGQKCQKPCLISHLAARSNHGCQCSTGCAGHTQLLAIRSVLLTRLASTMLPQQTLQNALQPL